MSCSDTQEILKSVNPCRGIGFEFPLAWSAMAALQTVGPASQHTHHPFAALCILERNSVLESTMCFWRYLDPGVAARGKGERAAAKSKPLGRKAQSFKNKS